MDIVDNYDVNSSSIKMYVQNISVRFETTPISRIVNGSIYKGYKVRCPIEHEFENGDVVFVNLSAEDLSGNKMKDAWKFIVDLEPPRIHNFTVDIRNESPYATNNPNPLISVDIIDEESDVRNESIWMYVRGFPVNYKSVSIEKGLRIFYHANNLSEGIHEVYVTAKDNVNRSSNKTWYFSVEPVQIEVENVSVYENETAYTHIKMENVYNKVRRIEILLTYEQSIVEVLNVTGVNFSIKYEIRNVSVFINGTSEGRMSETVDVANILLKARGGAGSVSPLNIFVLKIETPEGSGLLYEARNGSLIITRPSPSPSPTPTNIPTPSSGGGSGGGGGRGGGGGVGYMPPTTPRQTETPSVGRNVEAVEKTPQPTAVGIPQTLPAPSPMPTYFASPTPASEPSPTPLAQFPTIKLFIIIAIIACSVIIVAVLYLILRRSKE